MTSKFSAVTMIETKRSGVRPHTEEELRWWIESYCSDKIEEYQMSAWLMAVCWRGMTLEETGLLTKYMVQSGRQLQWGCSVSDRDYKLADKHSSGGVGDKISLILAPLVAAAGVSVPMMAGRGLGHTGGTLDKLESIPGYTVAQSEANFQKIVESVGCSICGTTSDMVLADRKLYALRDVTGTVASIALQTSSIISKKIAENPDSLVLDVKYGLGSFQKTSDDAKELAQSLLHTAEVNGIQPTTAFLTRMDYPIGRGIGNWLEVKECIDMMQGKRIDDDDGSSGLRMLVLCQAARMVLQAQVHPEKSFEEIFLMMNELLKSGKVLEKFRAMTEAHGGDVSVIDNPDDYPQAPFTTTVLAPQEGYVTAMDALSMGQASVNLGAGRQLADEPVDALAGLWLNKTVGDAVRKGDVVVTLHTSNGKALEQTKEKVVSAIQYAADKPTIPPIISNLVTSAGVQDFVSDHFEHFLRG